MTSKRVSKLGLPREVLRVLRVRTDLRAGIAIGGGVSIVQIPAGPDDEGGLDGGGPLGGGGGGALPHRGPCAG